MKINIHIYRSILLACLFLCQLAYGQQDAQKYYPQSSPANPEAANLIKAINYPVGYNTGIPEISIPLYEVKSRGITLPVSLSYHAGGFKTKELASAAGLGWNLSTNFQITREIHGFDDFRKSGNNTYAGYYYNNYGITNVPWNDALYTDLYRFEMANGMIDSQPDRFYYNIAGKSGSFYLSKTSTNKIFLPSPYNGISISCTPGSGDGTSVSFKIVDTDGTEYNFTLAETTSDNTNQTPSYESSWKCTSIVSADKTETVNLSYEPLKNLYIYADEEYTELYEDLNGLQGQPWSPYGGTFFANEVKAKANDSYQDVLKYYAAFNLSVPRSINYSLGGDAGFIMYTKDANADFGYRTTVFNRDFIPFSNRAQIQSRYAISAIKTSNMTMGFSYDYNECLKLVKVTDVQNRTVLSFYFDQSVVGNYESQYRTNRTNYLDALRIVDARGITTSYSLEYSSKYAFANYTKGGNFWGGVNSWTSDRDSQIGTTVPSFQINTKHYLSNNYNDYVNDFRIYVGGQFMGPIMMHNMPEQRYNLVGQLKKITYPTGGYTEFSFGGNYGYSADGSNSYYQLGGLRIEEIRNYNTDGSLQNKKIYKYGEYGEGIPCGVFYYSAETIQFPFNFKQEVEYFVNPVFEYKRVTADARDILETKTTFLANLLESMSYSNGSPVYYEKVTEYDYSISGENGKKEYLYTSPEKFGYQLHRKQGTTNILAPEEGWRMGQLEYEHTYRSTGNKQYALAHSVRYEYDYSIHSRTIHTDMPFRKRIVMGVYPIKGTQEYGQGEITDPMLLKELGSSNYVALYSDDIYTGAVYPIRKTETSYDGGKPSSVITEYQYDAYSQPTVTTVTHPDGHKVKESLTYANEFPTSIPFIQAMKAANQVGIPVQISQSRIEGGNEQPCSGVIRLFRADNPALVEKVYVLAPGSSSSASDGGMNLPAGYYQKALFGYDGQNNVVSQTTNDSPSTVYLWGYGNQYVVAKICKADYGTVRAILGDAGIAALQQSYDPDYIRRQVQALRVHPQMATAQVSTFTYSLLTGVNEITGPDGVKTGYIYDGAGRLESVTDHQGYKTTGYEYHYVH